MIYHDVNYVTLYNEIYSDEKMAPNCYLKNVTQIKPISLSDVPAFGRRHTIPTVKPPSEGECTDQYHLWGYVSRGGSMGGGGVLGVRIPPFWSTPKLHKKGKKTLHACVRLHRVLVLNSYPDPPPPPAFPKSCIRPCSSLYLGPVYIQMI